MSASLQRLTLYALISSLEADLRVVLIENLLLIAPLHTLVDALTLQKAIERLTRDRAVADQSFTDEDVINYLDFGDGLQCIGRSLTKLPAQISANIKNFYAELERIIPIRNRVMHSRPLDFDDLATTSDLCRALISSATFMWHEVRETVRRLKSNPNVVTNLSIPSDDYVEPLLHNLPAPDFDDTGFFGRDTEIKSLRSAIQGSYPVITVAGEGGIGKSALALKVAYDVVDDPSSQFDAVVWVTAKANRLTPYEIKAINHAITTSFGVLEAAANYLGRQSHGDPVEDLLAHLANNKILLVIDNLETIVDHTIRQFVSALPQGSKVVFTTRIGLGAFDFPIKLPPFSVKESQHYFRRTARVWGISDLAKLPDSKVGDYCKRLQYNPLFIKWFVQGVRSGQRAEAILANPKILLEFCLQNVFQHLDADTKRIAHALLTVGGYQSASTLAYITELRTDRLQAALTALISANLIGSRRAENIGGDDEFALSSLPQLYLANYYPPSSEDQAEFLRKRNILRSTRDELSAQTSNIYSMDHIAVSEDGHVAAASFLVKAAHLIKQDRLSDAEVFVKQAADLAPSYFEVKRVEAQLAVLQRNFVKAEACYEAAVSLAPESAPLRLWYAGFLSRMLSDTARAMIHARAAQALDPMSPSVTFEVVRLHLYGRNFEEAADLLSRLTDKIDSLPARSRRVFHDLRLQLEVRRADACCRTHPVDALKFSKSAKTVFESIPPALIDELTKKTAARLSPTLSVLSDAFRNLEEMDELVLLRSWLDSLEKTIAARTEGRIEFKPGRNQGALVQVHSNFAFIQTDGGNIFFHRGEWKSHRDFSECKEGEVLVFSYGHNSQGPCAINVCLADDEVSQPSALGQAFSGIVKSVRETFGFIVRDDGEKFFFHRSHMMSADDFSRLREGEVVHFVLGRNKEGVCADQVSLARSTE